MSEIEPYGVMPYSELSDLKRHMKKIESKDDVDSKELLQAVTGLTKHMDSMLHLFKTAADEMRLEEEEEKALSKQIRPLMDKIDEIIEQNKIIAEGMVALSDIVKERMPENKNTQPPGFNRTSPSEDQAPKFSPRNDSQNQEMPSFQKPSPFPPPPNQSSFPPPNQSSRAQPPPSQPVFPPSQQGPNDSFMSDMPPPPQVKKKGLFGKK